MRTQEQRRRQEQKGHKEKKIRMSRRRASQDNRWKDRGPSPVHCSIAMPTLTSEGALT